MGMLLTPPLPAPLRGGAGGGGCSVLFQVVPQIVFFRGSLRAAQRLYAAGLQQMALMLQHHYPHRGLLVRFLYHSSVLLLFDDYFLTIVHIDALAGGLTRETCAVERVPALGVDGHLASRGVERADGGHYARGAH